MGWDNFARDCTFPPRLPVSSLQANSFARLLPSNEAFIRFASLVWGLSLCGHRYGISAARIASVIAPFHFPIHCIWHPCTNATRAYLHTHLTYLQVTPTPAGGRLKISSHSHVAVGCICIPLPTPATFLQFHAIHYHWTQSPNPPSANPPIPHHSQSPFPSPSSMQGCFMHQRLRFTALAPTPFFCLNSDSQQTKSNHHHLHSCAPIILFALPITEPTSPPHITQYPTFLAPSIVSIARTLSTIIVWASAHDRPLRSHPPAFFALSSA